MTFPVTRALFVVLGISVAFGQSDRGNLTGTISDPAGAVVANANIGVKNVDSGVSYQSGSSGTGNYVIPLPTGNYELTVTAPGFKKYIRAGIVVPVAQTVRLDVDLEVGASSESVTVTAEASVLKTESGEISHNVAVDQLNTLPVLRVGANIRSPYAAATLLPGMVWTGGTFQSMRVNGMPDNTQAFRVDGQDSTNGTWQIAASQVQPSVDATQEVAVQTSNFAAEYGQAGGGVFNLTMRSGSNKFHGSAYDYMTNEALNAGLPQTSNTAGGKPNEHIRNRGRQNDYGFSIGGPVLIPKLYDGRNRTFFFFNFEQWRNKAFTSSGLYTVPTDAERAGDFSNTGLTAPRTYAFDPSGKFGSIVEGGIYDPLSNLGTYNGFVVRSQFPGNQIPLTRMDPLVAKIQALLPKANIPGQLTLNYRVPTYSVPNVQGIPSVKIDQNLNAKMKLSGYWSESRVDNPGGDGLPDPLSTRSITQDRAHTIRLNFDDTITPTLLLHVGIGYVHLNSLSGAPPLTDNTLLVPNVNDKTYLSYFSTLSAGSRGGYTQGLTSALGPQQIRRFWNEKPTANTSLTWVRNNHTYKAGGELIIDSFPAAVSAYANGNFAFSANETSQPVIQLPGAPFTPGHNYASFLLGAVDSGSTAAVANSRLGNHAIGAFVQDTFKVNRRLTLEYGLRYDYVMYLREQYGRVPTFSPSTPNPTVGGILGGIAYEGNLPGHCNCSIAKNYPFAFGPRFGAAYQVNTKTVLRAGIGVLYGKAPEFGWLGGSINGLTNFATSNPYSPTLYLSKDGMNVPSSFGSANTGAFPVTPAGRQTPTYLIDQNAGRPARTVQWSIALQREVVRNLTVEASYVANRSVWAQSNISQVNVVTNQIATAQGFNLSNLNDLTTLGKPLSATLGVDPRVKLPYTGFPLTALTYNILRPYPQFNSNMQLLWSPTGKTWYDSLQAKLTKRYSHGLDMQGAFTWGKELTVGAENSYALFGFPTPFNDVTNYNQNKYLSGQSRPFQLVVSASYLTPKWGGNKFVGLITGDWQIAAVLRYQSGALIQIPGTTNGLNNQIGRGGNLSQRIPGVPLYLTDINSKSYDPSTTLLINPAAFQQVPAGQFSNSTPYYNDLRGPRVPSESMNFGRNFRLGGSESKLNLHIRAEFSNIFNRRFNITPSILSLTTPTTYLNGVSGALSGGFGFASPYNGVGQTPRAGTLVARFTF